jgi:glycosyltransferase involved in cell wall biosynthesis
VLRFALQGYLFHLHVNGESIKGLVLAALASGVATMVGRRPVLTFHAGTDQTYFPRHKSRWVAPILKSLFICCQKIICNNAQVKSRIVEYGIASEKVVPIAPFSRQYLEELTDILDRKVEAFLASHSPIVLTYIELRPEYALDALFGALSKISVEFPELGLVVVGAANESEAISRLANSARLEERFLHVGGVDHAEFLSLLRRSTVYVRSNRTEGTSSSIREALALRTPVVANESPCHPQGVRTYRWGQADELARVLWEVLRDPQGVRNTIRPPEVTDTVAQEAELLIRCALLGRSRV